MIVRNGMVALVALGSCLSSGPSLAHHPVAASHETSTTVSLRGMVAKVIFAAPHCYLWLDVRDGADQITRWVIELDDAQKVGAAGLTRRAIAPGMNLSASTFSAKPGANVVDVIPTAPPEVHEAAMAGRLVHGIDIELPDGRKIVVGDD